MSVELRVLGALEMWSDGVLIPIAGLHRQKVLAELVLHLGERVPATRLAEVLWNDSPPPTSQQQLQRHLHVLRRTLGSAITTERGGYRLTLPPENVDAHRFAARVEHARALRRSGLVDEAADELVAALALWRGPALAGMGGAVRAPAARLDDQRLTAHEDWFELQISLGRHAEVLAEIRELAAQHPVREQLARHLMLAQYRGGRQADALATYELLRSRLSSELGVEPSEQLRSLHAAVLRQDPALDPAAADWSAPGPACLPMDLASFAGRAGELHRLTETVRSAVPIAAVTGTAGVGKTTLAVRWAHQVRDRFPDGQLYVDLRGHDQAPAMSVSDALSMFLRALDTPPERIPEGADARAALFRSTVDGKRMLVVLDNAASVDQVRPLLPGSPGCFVVITSRNALNGLTVRHDATRIGLDVLSDDEAIALLRGVLGDERVGAESAAADEVLRRCGNLPLALRIAAANLANRPHGTIADLVADLSEQDRLDVFDVPGERTGLRAALDLSYRAVGADARRMLALLGSSPLADIGPAAAAALTGTTVTRARKVLTELESAHLVRQHLPGRYRLHDLIRLYASEQEVTGLRDAVGGVLEHYLVQADAAVTKLAPTMQRESRPATITAVAGDVDAVAWLAGEHYNLVAAIDWARDHRHGLLATHLIDALRAFFLLHRLTHDWLATGHIGLDVARDLGDARLESAMHRTLGLAYYFLGDRHRSIEHNLDSLTLYEQLGDTASAAAMHINVSISRVHGTMLAESVRHAEEAVDLCVRNDLAHLEIPARLAVAAARSYQGELREAVAQAERALALAEQADNPYLRGNAMLVCAWLHEQMGRLRLAESHHAAGQLIYQEIGFRGGEVTAHVWQVDHCLKLGHLGEAEELITAALEAIEEQVDQVNEIDLLIGAARVQHVAGRLDTALGTCGQVIAMARDAGNARAEVEALVLLAAIHLSDGDFDEATSTAVEAIGLAESSGHMVAHGDAHQTIARVRLAEGNPVSASAHLEVALAWHRRTDQHLGVVADLLLLGDHDTAAGICHEVAEDRAPDVLRQLERTLTPST
ncbi:hypothetical protein FKR81_01215 [Lentzea tibetensis]|uniref:DNA-binding transcriptional activator of the SARP family n=1 Tax=Lentzea tibetensis TaxID=2591470 RepID=A0A563F2R5_9PSEU|nr:BTAD domain-containing putative transcriptional regulator [Lentzea tibetensis]TWP54209.1 hypothetical protein FKR81_01215 [Lentzea tibetensis]